MRPDHCPEEPIDCGTSFGWMDVLIILTFVAIIITACALIKENETTDLLVGKKESFRVCSGYTNYVLFVAADQEALGI